MVYFYITVWEKFITSGNSGVSVSHLPWCKFDEKPLRYFFWGMKFNLISLFCLVWVLSLVENSLSDLSTADGLIRLIYVGTIKNTREQNKNKEVTSKIVSAGRRINLWVVLCVCVCVCDNDIYYVIYMYMHMWNHWNSSFIINDKLQSYLKYYSSYFSALSLVQGEEEANNSAWRFD